MTYRQLQWSTPATCVDVVTPYSAGDLRPGTIVGNYRLETLIGRGGMGVVFRGTQIDLGRSVALKIINPSFAAEEDSRKRFVREARTGAAVEHPNALPIYEVGDERGLLFISMRYIEGSDLFRVIQREGYLEADRVVRLVRQIAAALDAAHAARLVHRDVKPHNILITQHGEHEHAYLTDFGLARHLLDSGLTSTGAALGTPGYMAPEQVLGRSVDARCDVYSLGVVLFQALTGVLPFEAESMHAVMYAHVNAPVPSASALNTAVDPSFDKVLQRAMAKNPAERYLSAGDLAEAAAAVLSRQPQTRPEQSSQRGRPRRCSARINHIPGSYHRFVHPIERSGNAVAEFDNFVDVLRSRNWTESDLVERVYPFAPAGWRKNDEKFESAIITVYEKLGSESRSRELLEILPGGSDNGLMPVEIGFRMSPQPDGQFLSKPSVRAVMRNLQRLENRLLEERAISRRCSARPSSSTTPKRLADTSWTRSTGRS